MVIFLNFQELFDFFGSNFQEFEPKMAIHTILRFQNESIFSKDLSFQRRLQKGFHRGTGPMNFLRLISDKSFLSLR